MQQVFHPFKTRVLVIPEVSVIRPDDKYVSCFSESGTTPTCVCPFYTSVLNHEISAREKKCKICALPCRDTLFSLLFAAFDRGQRSGCRQSRRECQPSSWFRLHNAPLFHLPFLRKTRLFTGQNRDPRRFSMLLRISFNVCRNILFRPGNESSKMPHSL